MSDLFSRLISRIARLEAQLGDMSRRMNNVMRESRVLEVDPSTGLAMVEAHGGKSKPVPWLQRAGDISDWEPPTVGERVLLISPNGDPGRGLILPGGYSKNFPAPHDQMAQSRRKIGGSSDTMSGTQRIIEAQTIILRGTVRIEGSSVTHNSTNIGDTHVHGGVEPGGSNTDTPH